MLAASTESLLIQSLLQILIVVLQGSGQGFHIAFRFDVVGYHSFTTAVSTLLRMAVGDFDYDQLQESQNVVGPAMFWMFIVLVYFILMSVFIALIGEAYERARDALRDERQNMMSRTPASGVKKTAIATAKKATNLVYNMTLAETLSVPLSHALRDPLIRAEQAMQNEIMAESEESVPMGKRIDVLQKKKCTKRFFCGSSPTRFARSKSLGVVRITTQLLNLNGGRNAVGKETLRLSHPVDTFTDDDDDPTGDETRDLIGGFRNAHLFRRIESHCQVTVYGIRNFGDSPEAAAFRRVRKSDVYASLVLDFPERVSLRHVEPKRYQLEAYPVHEG